MSRALALQAARLPGKRYLVHEGLPSPRPPSTKPGRPSKAMQWVLALPGGVGAAMAESRTADTGSLGDQRASGDQRAAAAVSAGRGLISEAPGFSTTKTSDRDRSGDAEDAGIGIAAAKALSISQRQARQAGCQQLDDTKGPLKDKGAAGMPGPINARHAPTGPSAVAESVAVWVREASAQLQAIQQEMAALALRTRGVRGDPAEPRPSPGQGQRAFAMYEYRRASTGQTMLRWRLATQEHATWEDVNALLTAMPPVLAAWYCAVNAQRVVLNARERLKRQELREARAVLLQLERAERVRAGGLARPKRPPINRD
jgi:hypothetical protein